MFGSVEPYLIPCISGSLSLLDEFLSSPVRGLVSPLIAPPDSPGAPIVHLTMPPDTPSQAAEAACGRLERQLVRVMRSLKIEDLDANAVEVYGGANKIIEVEEVKDVKRISNEQIEAIEEMVINHPAELGAEKVAAWEVKVNEIETKVT